MERMYYSGRSVGLGVGGRRLEKLSPLAELESQVVVGYGRSWIEREKRREKRKKEGNEADGWIIYIKRRKGMSTYE